MGLKDRGEIKVGKRADLVLVDQSDRVVQTFSAGETIFSNGAWLDSATQLKMRAAV